MEQLTASMNQLSITTYNHDPFLWEVRTTTTAELVSATTTILATDPTPVESLGGQEIKASMTTNQERIRDHLVADTSEESQDFSTRCSSEFMELEHDFGCKPKEEVEMMSTDSRSDSGTESESVTTKHVDVHATAEDGRREIISESTCTEEEDDKHVVRVTTKGSLVPSSHVKPNERYTRKERRHMQRRMKQKLKKMKLTPETAERMLNDTCYIQVIRKILQLSGRNENFDYLL